MAQWDNRYARSGTAARPGLEVVDEGLRSHMLRIYNYMAGGVALTGVVAYATAYLALSNPAVAQLLYGSALKWVLIFAPLAFVIYLGVRVQNMSVGATQATFWLFAATMGLSMSSIFLIFTGQSIAQVFFITAAAFAALSLWGYTTKRDLTAMGSFLFMGVIGILLAMIVNLFLGSPGLQWAISILGVLIFAGLTAYDTQRLKDMYYEVRGHAELAAKSAIMGALSLYLDFINMFQFLLSLMGNRQ